nr:glycosyl hydrolase [Acidobacteriota bacterium]
MMKKLFAAVSMLAVLSAAVFAQSDKDKKDAKADPLASLKYRSIGPAAGGRVSRVAGIPGDPSTYYAATASGGVWKSVNGGATWTPIFDDQPISSIGSIAVAASDPNIVYV